MPETFNEMVDRMLRDHEGYAGDGKGGVGDLPVGDRSTARKGIDKRDLRVLMKAPESYASRAEAAASTAEGVVGGVAYLDAARADSEAARDAAQQASSTAEAARDAATVNAQVYADTAAGLAATTVGDQFQVVSGDEIIRYRHDAGPVATEVARYPTAEKVAAIPAATDRTLSDAEVLVDDVGAVMRRTDSSGEQYVPGLGGRSVQAAIRAAETRASTASGQQRRDALLFEDSGGNILLRQSETGALYLPGMSGSVQHVTGQSIRKQPYFRTSREDLHPSVKPLVADLMADGRPFVAPPSLLVPNNYDVPSGIVSAFSVSKTTDLWLDTPYGLGGLVHPYLLEMRQPLHGYRYIMAESPHRNGSAVEENMILYGSHDLTTFDLLPDVPQPLGYDPTRYGGDYNSDPCLTYDPTSGALIAFWRAVGIPGGNGYFYRSTWNGIDWTPEEYHAPGATGTLSPSILYDPSTSLWHMWTVTPAYLMIHSTGPSPFGPWAQVGTFNTQISSGFRLWHLEVKWMGTKFVALANNDGENGNLYLGISTDGTSWTFGPGLISPSHPYPYKGSFIPEFDGDNLRLHIVWNTYAFPIPAGMMPTFHSETTNWVDLTTL